jgi:hypothetical protein
MQPTAGAGGARLPTPWRSTIYFDPLYVSGYALLARWGRTIDVAAGHSPRAVHFSPPAYAPTLQRVTDALRFGITGAATVPRGRAHVPSASDAASAGCGARLLGLGAATRDAAQPGYRACARGQPIAPPGDVWVTTLQGKRARPGLYRTRFRRFGGPERRVELMPD